MLVVALGWLGLSGCVTIKEGEPTATSVDRISASIPISYEGFKSYIDQGSARAVYEGIWVEATGKYTIGIVRTPEDKVFPVKGFILDSKPKNWRSGEVKIKFRRSLDRGVVTGSLFLENKEEIGATWRVTGELLELVASGNDFLRSVYVKQYPEGSAGFESKPISGSGTAWAISENGIFVTNHHVIDGAKKIWVGFRDSTPMEGRVLISDRRLDLAIIRVDSKSRYYPLPMTASPAENGSRVYAIGFPHTSKLGDQAKISDGLISGQAGFQQDVTRYQISAPINPGNSGGPLLDDRGNVVGVIVEKLSGAESVNFAIKSTYVASLLEQIGMKTPPPNTRITTPVDLANKYKSSILPVWVE